MRSGGRGAPRANPVSPSGFECGEEGEGGVGALASSQGTSIGIWLVWRSCWRDLLEASRVLRDGCDPFRAWVWVFEAGEWIPEGAGGFGYEDGG